MTWSSLRGFSFFLWSNGPDDELISVAAQGKLKEPAILDEQVRRMIADHRSDELVKNFAGQWPRPADIADPDSGRNNLSDFDDNLRQVMRTEAEMFFKSVLSENRSIFELLTGDYTFVNGRLAAHYGIPNVYGPQFRRVTLQGDLEIRRGLLGKGSILLATGTPIEILRCFAVSGLWENLLGPSSGILRRTFLL